MPRKKQDQAPGEAAGEPKRGLAIALPVEQERQMRRLSEKIGISLSAIRKTLETSPRIANQLTDELKKIHNAWLDTQAKAGDIFGPPDEASRG